MKALGPNFSDDLRAAGLGGLPISWSSGGNINSRENLTDAQRATLDQVVAAHTPADPLVRVKEQIKAEVDAAAERCRLKYITPGSGQAMEYQGVEREAAALALDPNPDPANYPLLASTIGVDIDPQTGTSANDLASVARTVRAAQAAWAGIGAAIRRTRLITKAGVEQAPTEAAARAVAAAAEWP